MYLIGFITILQICVVHSGSLWFEGQKIVQKDQEGSPSGEEFHITTASSPTECILKCRRECTESFFVKQEKECYCLKRDEGDASVVVPNETGLLYEEVTIFTKPDKVEKQVR